MCNFVNFSYRSPFENNHKVANKAHDHAGNKAQWAVVPAIIYRFLPCDCDSVLFE